MEQIKITLKGDVREFPKGSTVADVAKAIGAGLYKAACAGRWKGETVDLRTPLEEDGEPVKTELQCGGAAEGGGGVSVRPGQQHSHRGKVQAAVRKSCVGVGQGIPSSLGNSPLRQEV